MVPFAGRLVASVAKGADGWKVTPSESICLTTGWRPSRKSWDTAPAAVSSYFRGSVGGKELLAAVTSLSQ